MADGGVLSDLEVRKADFADLLARMLPTGNIHAWATAYVDPAILHAPALANVRHDPRAFARAVVEAIAVEGRLMRALADLRRSGCSAALIAGVQAILADRRPADNETLQAFSRQAQPFFASGPFRHTYERMVRAVCAVGVYRDAPAPAGAVFGSGFLIGPDLLMTNAHVIRAALDLVDGRLVEAPGTRIFAFFDYLQPPVPGFEGEPQHCRLVRSLPAGWLVSARPDMPRDGLPDAGPLGAEPARALDYAVIKLEEPVGEQAIARGGGGPRGWLSVPQAGLPLAEAARPLFLFQHPGAAEQSWDMGGFYDVDHTGSRLRYGVSAAHGSSGGATVDADGRLFALHVAEVAAPPAGARLNQGVRMDYIAAELAADGLTQWSDPAALQRGPADFWSLRDDSAAPIIGRRAFRDAVLASSRAPDTAGPWALVCRGREGSGRRFSIALLRRILGHTVPIAHLDPESLAMPAKDVVARLAARLGIDDGDVPPDPLPQEDEPRWWRNTLPQWLRERARAATTKMALPVWVVVDRIFPADQADLPWGAGVREVIRAMLAAGNAQDETGASAPEFRWLFVGGPDELFPVPAERRFEDLLPDPETYRAGRYDPETFDSDAFDAAFSDCLRLAWWAAQPQDPLPEAAMPGLAATAREQASPVAFGASLIRNLVDKAARR